MSRILSPQEYGIVAVVNVFLVFFQMLANFGIGPAIIQNKSLGEKDIQSIYSFSLILALLLGVIFMFFGYPISIFYSNKVYIKISILLGFCVIFNTLSIVPQAVIQKEKRFKEINFATIIANILSAIFSVLVGLVGGSYYALIIGNIVRAIYLFLYCHKNSELTFEFIIDSNPLLKIYKFSKNQFLFNFIDYFSRNLDNILIGRYFSASALAYYNKAYQLSLYPNQVLTSVITPVVQPVMSNFETSIDQIKKVYFIMVSILANIGIPLSVFLFFSSEEIIIFLFGNQWIDSVMTFKILSASVWVQMIQSSSGSIFQSANRTELLLLSGGLTATLNIVSIALGITLGTIENVAILIVISFTVNFFINNYIIMYRLFNSNFGELFKVLIKPMVMGGIQIIIFIMLPNFLVSNFLRLLIKIGLFTLGLLLGIVITRQQKMLKLMIK